MEFFDGIKTFLFLVSSILLYPVLLLLALSALVSLWAMPETDLLAADFVLSAKETVCVPSGEAP